MEKNEASVAELSDRDKELIKRKLARRAARYTQGQALLNTTNEVAADSNAEEGADFKS